MEHCNNLLDFWNPQAPHTSWRTVWVQKSSIKSCQNSLHQLQRYWIIQKKAPPKRFHSSSTFSTNYSCSKRRNKFDSYLAQGRSQRPREGQRRCSLSSYLIRATSEDAASCWHWNSWFANESWWGFSIFAIPKFQSWLWHFSNLKIQKWIKVRRISGIDW